MGNYIFKVGRWYVGRDSLQFKAGKYINKKNGDVIWTNYYPTLQDCALGIFRKDFMEGIEEHEEFDFEKIDEAIKKAEKRIIKTINSL